MSQARKMLFDGHYYAGIGSRKTPIHIQDREDRIAQTLYDLGFTLRSGGARGSDTAFEYGAKDRARIYRPEEATEESMEFASRFHSAWHKCDYDARRLLGRNPFQVLGDDMNGPNSDFVVCWTEDGGATGGTGLALKIAMWAGIPIFNLFWAEEEARLWRFISELYPRQPVRERYRTHRVFARH